MCKRELAISLFFFIKGDHMKRDYFYCYSTNLFQYLRFVKNIDYICTGLHVDTKKQFWQFNYSKYIEEALNEYRGKKVKNF